MIAWLDGVLREKQPTRILVDVGGVGYELLISLSTFAALPDAGEKLALQVRTIVREDAFVLHGFATERERSIFDLLLKAGRVGPKLAQTILSGLEPEQVLRALRDGDVKLLCGAPGVGRKMAERMVVELKERAGELSAAAAPGAAAPVGAPAPGHAETRDQVLSALVNLGYPRSQAERVVDAATGEAGDSPSIEELIRIALRRLAR
ncbi:MAG: Holliday junction branch migration protein RuvA [Deltaproteobacteria bacterium]|nr:Holliday junction branch migration protein RuvA [Deltaproteobacteria bacterium]MBW2419585.1 Holliday junction branch migration protein RuvA [Deltaproteobacteria bacterium]